MKTTLGLVITLVLAAFGAAAAQIGEAPASLIDVLDYDLTLLETPQNGAQDGAQAETGERFEVALDGAAETEVTLETRGDALYRVAGEGVLDEAGTVFLADLVGAASGYGEGIAQPVKQFFDAQAAQFAGQGRIELSVEEYVLGVTVTGQAPYRVAYTLALQEVDPARFPEPVATLGPEDASYVIREFSDFQCPACQAYSQRAFPELERTLLARDDVRFEFHHLPLMSIHPNAAPAAEAAECVVAANDEAAFWPYHDVLFERQAQWNSLGDPNSYFVELVGEVGLEAEGVAACLEAGEFRAAVEEAYRVATVELGLNSTPTVFVNGFRVTDPFDVERYQALFRIVDRFAE